MRSEIPIAASRHCLIVMVEDCNLQTFIAVNGNGVADVLDLGSHVAPVKLRVWDMLGKLVAIPN